MEFRGLLKQGAGLVRIKLDPGSNCPLFIAASTHQEGPHTLPLLVLVPKTIMRMALWDLIPFNSSAQEHPHTDEVRRPVLPRVRCALVFSSWRLCVPCR